MELLKNSDEWRVTRDEKNTKAERRAQPTAKPSGTHCKAVASVKCQVSSNEERQNPRPGPAIESYRAALTPPLRLSTVCARKMNLFADCDNSRSQIAILKGRAGQVPSRWLRMTPRRAVPTPDGSFPR